MTETEFKQALAEFATKTADELAMTDDLAEVGVDSIAVYEFLMTVEDRTGAKSAEVDDKVASVQDLFDAVLEASERQNA
ncbi:acyl carrier protein [Glycomyces paridis]|uniref:Acyl carrier protein n=1 Tax=Glycomyces paridis TaxID=2126555 RepID=A0A4S8P5U8_9ACTN|nr:acyl carrier protein [Glycomyces paridis]THV24615.1 acyl carrier protein [Glycomyces paridis]